MRHGRFQSRAARIAAVTMLAALSAACSQSTAPAPDTREIVNVYNWADYIAADTIAQFEAETGVKVNYDTYDTSEIVGTKLLAGNTGYDVVIHAAQYYPVLIPTGVYRPLDKDRITHWAQLAPEVLDMLARYDPGNRHAVPYMYGSTGFAYNVDMIRARMPDAPVDSGDMLFKPEVVSRFADCGVSFLDSPTNVLPMALAYLGLDANTRDRAEIARAEALLVSVRPYIKYFSSTKMLNDMPNGEICIAMSWSGDYTVAVRRARDAGLHINLAYTAPIEGSTFWIDGMLIPADAPHVDNAYRFIDFILRPDVLAQISREVGYANASIEARARLEAEFVDDPAVYPPPEMLARLQANVALPPKFERLRTRAFANVKRGR